MTRHLKICLPLQVAARLAVHSSFHPEALQKRKTGFRRSLGFSRWVCHFCSVTACTQLQQGDCLSPIVYWHQVPEARRLPAVVAESKASAVWLRNESSACTVCGSRRSSHDLKSLKSQSPAAARRNCAFQVASAKFADLLRRSACHQGVDTESCTDGLRFCRCRLVIRFREGEGGVTHSQAACSERY